MEFPKRSPCGVYRGASRKQPFHSKPSVSLRGADEPASAISTWILKFDRAAGGWTPGLCIQLASIDFGAVAQLGERLICIQEVAGSIPTSSTSVAGEGGPGL